MGLDEYISVQNATVLGMCNGALDLMIIRMTAKHAMAQGMSLEKVKNALSAMVKGLFMPAMRCR
jgi:hypothetical protein